jgi:hypothetical protein
MAIQIQSYQQRVATPSPGGSPALRAVKGADTNISGEINQLVRVYDQIEDDQAETEAMKAVAATRMSVEEDYRTGQETAKPGADGFTPGFMEKYNGKVTQTSDGLSSELARKKFNEKMLGFGVSLQDRALTWEAGQRQSERKRSFEEAADNHASTLFSTDAGNRESTFDMAHAELEKSLESVMLPPDQKAELREKVKLKMAYGAVQGDLRDRPEKVQDWAVHGGGGSYYGTLRQVESGGRNTGSDTSSAFGPYQFTAGTWDSVIAKHPELGLTKKDRFDPTSQEVAIRAFTEDNTKTLKAAGLPATNVNLYMTHFLGEAGGPRFIKAVIDNPNDEARMHATPGQVAANPGVFKQGRTVAEVYALFGKKFGANEGVKEGPSTPAYYSSLSFTQRNSIYDQADAEMRKRRTEGAAAFKQQVDNNVAQYAAQGFADTSLGEQQFIAAYGVQRGTIAYGEFQAATVGAKAQHDLKTLDLSQHAQYIEGMRPETSDEFYAEKLKGFEQAKAVSQQIRSAIKEDAAAYVIGYNPKAQEALVAVTDLQNSDDQKRGEGAQAYAALMKMEYDRLGVPQGMRRIVPKSYAENISTSLQAKLSSDAGATQVVSDVNKIAAAWGSDWPKVYGDIAEKLSAPLRVITAGIDPGAASILASVATKSFDDLASVFPKSTKTDIRTYLQSEFDPYVKSTGFQASALPNVNTFYEQGAKLAAVYVGQGETGADAAAKAYKALIGDKYRMVNESAMNVRIPKPVDVPGMEEALRYSRAKLLEAGDVMLAVAPPGVALTDEDRDSRTRSWLDRNAKWVTKPDDSGVALMVGDKVWRDSKGKLIERTWTDIAREREDMAIDAENAKGPFGWSFN